jgi:hypothetical protein
MAAARTGYKPVPQERAFSLTGCGLGQLLRGTGFQPVLVISRTRIELAPRISYTSSMFDEPDELNPAEKALDPIERAREKADEFRLHAELCAVFEGTRKFNASIQRLDANLAREIQVTMAKLEKSRSPQHPVLPEKSIDAAKALLDSPSSQKLSTNDYHIYRRPGEVMIVRWLAGDEVESFYTRFQAHFDAAMNQYREEERQSLGWKQDAQTLSYLDALDALSIKVEERYLRPIIREHDVVFVLSTHAADELDILHLSDAIMGVDAADIVGQASAPSSDQPTEQERAWFFKLFSLRGTVDKREAMCFFAYLQKSDEGAW